MRPFLLVVLVALSLSCQKDFDNHDRLYGKWLLLGGSALQWRQAIVKQPIYFTFSSTGSVESNWSSCYSYKFGNPGELLVRNGCVDCAVVGCDESVWHYTFTPVNGLSIEFKAGDTGILQRQ
ncbi:hypothetical protein [Spirosoma radiotolerans]|uniref:Uncharacterized protein n=1 Tax=Spirosoma radiotolerans TaxID=1379870 RepID=A0A0E3V8K8_9BACT|nr:hypothetical protein [Spirosoma radiotolerans]AKD56396.1 hypothetical protein SD10_17245 [Spirosoma radiotolerans]